MRSEQEMYRMILEIAGQDSRILAIYMNGSRTNKNAPRDIFQDYDIVYAVKETAPFIEDRSWINKFGDIMYMQYPDEFPGCSCDKENVYGWLMQFTDGNRVDLTIETVAFAQANILNDKLCKVLLDKNGILPSVEEATDREYWVKRPSKEEFLACCNEFWWCSNNLAKGLWRNEIPYVQDMTNFVVRKQLENMLSWKIGVLKDWQVSVGKSAKYMYRWLSAEEYDRYLATYFGGNTEEAWKAIMTMCDMLEETACWVAEHLGYTYNREEGEAAKQFLEHVRKLPKDAAEVY